MKIDTVKLTFLVFGMKKITYCIYMNDLYWWAKVLRNVLFRRNHIDIVVLERSVRLKIYFLNALFTIYNFIVVSKFRHFNAFKRPQKSVPIRSTLFNRYNVN